MERMQTRNLPFYAGTCAAWGLTKEQTLQLITGNSAKILGIDNQYGTLESGKSATLFISRRRCFRYENQCHFISFY